MENNNQNQSEDLLRQILTETSGDTPKRQAPVFSAAAREDEPLQEAVQQPVRPEPQPQPVVQQPPIEDEIKQSAEEMFDALREERTTVRKAPPKAVIPAKAPQSKADDDLYEDLDGISQTQVQRRKAAGSNNNGNKKKKKRSKSFRALKSIILTEFILGVSVFFAYLIITYGRDVLGINNDNTTKIVTIPQGAGTQEIAELLEEEGIITYPKLFTTFAGFSGKDSSFTAGDHELRPDMAYDTIFENLASPSLGSEDVVDIAFPEGINLVETAELLEDQGVCDADEFIEYFNNESKFGLAYEEHLPSFTTDKFYKMEGYMFPDTYQFYKNMDVDLVCQKILRNFNSKITERDYARMEELGVTLDEVITLASIIQHEAGSVDQMSRISSVFWNRLNHPDTYPKLQSDPTGNYVEEVIKPHIDAYNEEMFDAYDTYICNGLPAGAICSPGYDAIQAALYPASTDYYYFYANLNTRETYFSRTLAEHEAWIEKVEGHNYVATEPVNTLPIEGTDAVQVGVGTSEGDSSSTTTTEAAVGNIW